MTKQKPKPPNPRAACYRCGKVHQLQAAKDGAWLCKECLDALAAAWDKLQRAFGESKPQEK
jgi:ribosomal protein L37AE/L43A